MVIPPSGISLVGASEIVVPRLRLKNTFKALQEIENITDHMYNNEYFSDMPFVRIGLLFVFGLKNTLKPRYSRILGLKGHTSLRVSLLLAGGGEFVFVIFSPLVSEKFLPPGAADLLFVVVILSMALTPFLAVLGKWCADKYQVQKNHADPQHATEELGEFNNHIIIAGFGRMGQMLGELLASKLIPFVALDTDMRCVTEGRKRGWPVFYGDARRLEVLKSVGAGRSKAIVITLNQMTPSVRTVLMLRRYFPDLPICVRIKDQVHQEKLVDSGARLVVPETLEPTLQLAASIFHLMGVPQSEVSQLLDDFRHQHWSS